MSVTSAMRPPEIDGHTKWMVRGSQHDLANEKSCKAACALFLRRSAHDRMVDDLLVIAYCADSDRFSRASSGFIRTEDEINGLRSDHSRWPCCRWFRTSILRC